MDSFAFTKLAVVDLDGCTAFYASVFGLTERSRHRAEQGERALEEIVISPMGRGTAGLVLYRFADVDAVVRDEVTLGFQTDDLDACCERVVAAGGVVELAPRDFGGAGYRIAFVRDPEGHVCEILETPRADGGDAAG
jgi:predicted enzyme related to lactoylglutathione lyase